jgi:hypothetical protein
MIENSIISFNKPSQDVIDITPYLYDIEYKPHDIYYALKGLYHVLLMHEARKLKSEQELPNFIKTFSINLNREYDTAFFFRVDKFIDSGLLVPTEENTLVEAFNRDLFNMLPGFGGRNGEGDTPEERQLIASAKLLNTRAWTPSDFLNPDFMKRGSEFGETIFNQSIKSYKKYSVPEMNSELSQKTLKVFNYYTLIIQQAK